MSMCVQVHMHMSVGERPEVDHGCGSFGKSTLFIFLKI